ncbi:hypothetical protein JCM10207_005578 [Rhodosporidiobolus poonsookiae]
MSPFRTRHPTADSAHPPHASPPPSRIPTSRSSSSLALFRTRSRGNDLDEPRPSPQASPEWTIRPVQRRGSDHGSEPASPPLGAQGQLYPTYSHDALAAADGGAVAPHQAQAQPNKLQKWLSRSHSSATTQPSASSSHAPPSAPTPDAPPPLIKTRSVRSRSIGSLNLLAGAVSPKKALRPSSADPASSSSADAAAPSLAPPPPNPTISISSSPSTIFSASPSPSPSTSPALSHASTASSAAPVEPHPNPLRRTSVASTASSSHSHSQPNSLRGTLAHLSLKPGSNSRRRAGGTSSGAGGGGGKGKSRASTDEVLDEWATADLEEGDDEGRQISDEMVRAASRTSSHAATGQGGAGGRGSLGHAGGGKIAQSLRRTRSGLKLFGGGGGGAAKAEEGLREPPTPGPATAGVYGAGSGASPSSSAVDLAAPTPTSAVFPSPSPSAHASDVFPSPHPSTNPHTTVNGNVAGRLGGWFSSMLHGGNASASSTHLPLPDAGDGASTSSAGASASASSAPSSPEKTHSGGPFSSPGASLRFSPGKKTSLGPSNGSSSGAGAGRLGALDRMFDRAVRYFLDSDAQADRCEDEIWVLGVRHSGYVPPPPPPPAGEDASDEEHEDGEKAKKRRSLPSLGRKSRSPVKQRKAVAPPPPPLPTQGASSPSPADPFVVPSPAPSPDPSTPHPAAPAASTVHGWPLSFYHDFFSRPALTYRSGFPFIACDPSLSLASASGGGVGGVLSSLGASIGRGPRVQPGEGAGERGLTSDTGWGCMLRTGQSLLANALFKVHLGRDWRRPLPWSAFPPTTASNSSGNLLLPSPPPVPSAALYARLLSLFLDAPSPTAPFSVHNFTAQGKLLGKAPGEWFGPSTAAGAIKALVGAYEPAGLGVVSCVDGALYESEVVAATGGKWEKPVLVLINLRLGIDGVNPIYHEAIKGIFRFPQSVGIAGGRPSSSYYFVGAQANSLFYIDPHHPRPAIPLVVPPPEVEELATRVPLSPSPSAAATAREPRKRVDTQVTARGVDDSFVTIAPSPSARSTSPCPSSSAPTESSASASAIAAAEQLEAFFLSAYPDAAWATYHTEKVRKCALASLDPSMLVGFLVHDGADWRDFRARVHELSQTSAPMFSIASAPPSWMRRSASSAPPPPSNLASASDPADDSFSEVGSPRLGVSPSAGESSTGFSEPDDWELDSTDGLSESPDPSSAGASGSGSRSGAASARKEDAAGDEEWERAEDVGDAASRSVGSGSGSSGGGGGAQAPKSSSSSPRGNEDPDSAVVVERPPLPTFKLSELEAEWEGI